MQLNDGIIAAILEMREAQRNYFQTKSGLSRAKSLEAKVDDMLSACKVQPADLFGSAAPVNPTAAEIDRLRACLKDVGNIIIKHQEEIWSKIGEGLAWKVVQPREDNKS